MKRNKDADRAATAERKRRSSNAPREAAAARAEEIRQKLANPRGELPGTILGKEAGWHYTVIPSDATERTKDMARLACEAKGFEKVTDGHITVAGHVNPEAWRIPDEIHNEFLAAEAAEMLKNTAR